MGYRNRFDIIADMLSVANGRAKKTKIMYQANLSYKLLKKYLIEAKRSNLVTYERKGRCYALTPKGEEFLKKYKQYSKHAVYVEKHLTHFKLEEKNLRELCPE